MQKSFALLSVSAIIAVMLFSSCGKTNKQGRYIPANAGVVFMVDGESLNAKLPWDEVKQNEIFNKMMADTSVPAFAKLIMENPESSGVNIKSDLIMFMVKDTLGGYAAVMGNLKDAAKFKQFLGNANKEAKEISKEGYTYFSDYKSSVGYNKDKFIITMNTPQLKSVDKMDPMSAPGDTSFTMPEVEYTRDMNAITAMVINLKEGNSLGKNERFGDMMKGKGDVHFWFNAEQFNATAGLGAMAAIANLGKFTEGAVVAGIANFDNGKIIIDAKSYGGKEMTDIYRKYSAESFDKSMVKNIPSQNIAGMFALSFKPEGMRELLKFLGVDGLFNMGTAQMGFNLDDAIKANKGDFLIAITDIKDDTAKGKDGQFIFAAAIGDKPSFNKLIDAGRKVESSMNTGDSSTNKYTYNTNDKYFVLTNNKTTTASYLAGTANTSYPFMDKISGGPMGGYVNFQYIMNALKPKVTADSIDRATYDASIKMWDNLYISGGNFKDGGITQHWEINLMDKNTNSLKQLNSYSSVMGLIDEKRQAKNMDKWRNEDVMWDTTSSMPGKKPVYKK